jgi:hypothetical protein
MATITEVEKLALRLPEDERAVLAAHLLGSLPAVLVEADDGLAEARSRDAELDANTSLGTSLAQVDRRVSQRRQD